MKNRWTALLAVLSATIVWALSGAVAGAAGSTAGAVPPPTRSIAVVGTGASMYPAFDSATTRYALTTGATTAGQASVTATTSDPAGKVYVDGVLRTSAAALTGLKAGDEISVIIDDSAGRTAYSVIYLPVGFPELDVTTHEAGLADGLIGLTLNTFEGTPLQAYDAIIDRNGVPVYAVEAAQQDLDLRQQPDDEITVSRPTTAPGKTGTDLVTLDDQLAESTRRHVQGTLVNTDGHDGIRLTDGSTILIGYEPNTVSGKTDATIQKIDSAGDVTFSWSSASIADETVANAQTQGAAGDYAHINSVVSSTDGDIIVSFRHLSAVLRIATVAHDGYQAGDVIWRLGGRDSDFTFLADPFPGGPCAQHTASELPNGHILLFDNGSNGLCINPLDPAGAPIDRGATRISEYALDTTLHTATLVWSYAPADTYASFAGSARRMPNGNTLIGWADDRDVLATEVNDAKQVLWQVVAPQAQAGHKKYMTYRAELITALTDKIDPVVSVTGPADGAHLLVGQSVSTAISCTDRGGSNLTTCSSTGVGGGKVDTSTPGSHTWTATGTDGAGNTTTVTRHYDVRLPVRRADGQVRRSDVSTWKGNNLYGPATNQTVVQSVARGRAGTSYWRIQNDGELADSFTLGATPGTAGFAVRYWSNGKDVTKAISAGAFRTAQLAPGAVQQVRIVISPKKVQGAAASKGFVLRASSPASSAAADRVEVRVTVPAGR
jgi:hypothetical protein